MLIGTVTFNNGSIIKNLFLSIKTLADDINMRWSENGIELYLTESITYVWTDLKASNLDQFKCSKTVVIGINTASVYDILDHVTKNEVVVISLKENQENMHYLEISISDTNVDYVYEINTIELMDKKLSDDVIKYKGNEHSAIISIPAIELKQLIQKFGKSSMDCIKLVFKNNSLFFMTKNQLSSGNIKYRNPNIIKSDHDISTNLSKKKLLETIKCVSLSKSGNVEIMLENDYPIFFEYPIDNYGSILIAIPSQNNEHY